VGVSKESSEQAGLAAKAELSAQLSSQLKAVSKRHYAMTETRSGLDQRVAAEYQRFTQNLEVSTAFERAELIRLDAAAAVEQGGSFYAFAYLPREDILAEDRRVYAEAETKLVALVEEARRAFATKSWSAFHTCLGQLRPLGQQLRTLAARVALVAGEPHATHTENEGRLLELIGDEVQWRSRTYLVLDLTGSLAAAHRTFWSDTLTTALQRIGVRVGTLGDPVYAAGLRLKAQERCEQRYLGFQCSLDLRGQLRALSDDRVLLDLVLTDPAWRGEHVSDQNRALDKAYRAVTAEGLAKALKEKLGEVLPITETQDQPPFFDSSTQRSDEAKEVPTP